MVGLAENKTLLYLELSGNKITNEEILNEMEVILEQNRERNGKEKEDIPGFQEHVALNNDFSSVQEDKS